MRDFRYALRQVLRAPGFALVAILSLALGIGANTAVFSLANALLFQPITALRPDEVVRVYRGRHSPLAWDEFVRVRALGGPLAQVGGERSLRVGRTDTEVPEALTASLVVGDYFAVLGAIPAAGRLFTAASTRARARRCWPSRRWCRRR